MNAEIFAEWLRRQGHSVKRTASSYWHNQGPRIFQAFPYHWVIQPQDGEIDELLRRERCIGVRYSTPVSVAEGRISYHVVLPEPDYSLESLTKKARRCSQGWKKCNRCSDLLLPPGHRGMAVAK